MKELIEIQADLKCNKTQFNKFGNYNYRKCEDILEAVKPLLLQYKCLLTITDSIILIGDRYYIEATATLKNKDGIVEICKAYAREDLSKKGMDSSQVTGSTSSYARKYALNGLFCIDDAADPDSMDNKKLEDVKPTNTEKRKYVYDKLIGNEKALNIILNMYNVGELDDLTESQISDVHNAMMLREQKNNKQ